MASAHDNFERGIPSDKLDSGSEGKGQVLETEDVGKDGLPAVAIQSTRKFEAPEFIRNMSPEERLAVEAKLKRKIDLRLMPMIVLMYIMNYLDRVSLKKLVLG